MCSKDGWSFKLLVDGTVGLFLFFLLVLVSLASCISLEPVWFCSERWFRKVHGSRASSDSSFLIVERKASLLALLTVYK